MATCSNQTRQLLGVSPFQKHGSLHPYPLKHSNNLFGVSKPEHDHVGVGPLCIRLYDGFLVRLLVLEMMLSKTSSSAIGIPNASANLLRVANSRFCCPCSIRR